MNLGEWTTFVREVAGFSFSRAREMGGWPLRELLIAYIAVIREQTLEAFKHTQLLYQIRTMMGGKEQEPPIPPLLRETGQR